MTQARTRPRLLAVVLTAALLAASCGDDDSGDGDALDSLQAGTSDSSAETGSGGDGKTPLGALEFGTEYTMTVDPDAAPNTLSIPPGSVTTIAIEAAAANTGGAGLASADGSLFALVDPGGTGGTDAPIITAKEEGLELTITAQGVPGDRFTFTIENEPQPDDPEGGDAPEIITDAVAIDGSTTGLLGGPDQTDYYTFEAAAGDIVTIGVAMAGDAEGNVTAALEFNGTEQARANASPGGEEETQLILSGDQGGEWFVKVWGTGTYDLTVGTTGQTDGGGEGDAPDSTTGAVPVEAGTFTGILGNEDRNDFYAIELEPGGVVEVGLSNDATSRSTLTIRLVVNGEEKDRASAAAGGSESFLVTFPDDVSGTAHLEVWGSGGSYEVELSLGRQEDGGKPGDAGPDAGTAVDVKMNSTFEGILSLLDRNDWYAATAKAGPLPYSVTVDPEAGSTVSVRILVDGEELDRVSAAAGGTEKGSAEIEAAGKIQVEVWGSGGAYAVTLGTDDGAGADND